ncbi:hypothetical protein [Streptomyces sp. NBC_01408]|uniref:hypothetical protein n=1 Tax=Streptomyces sp. NBC_01408 TaxID=2903855 RepID=UPI00225B5161|nr:hypothetical protein [Streptomyces sp. NBC_01408]MCX4694789.1 hypothetical protein [Streptomyces sp. NBC_01408]
MPEPAGPEPAGPVPLGEAQRTKERLGIVCAKAEEIRDDLRNGALGNDDLLEEVLTAARERRDITDRLDQLHAVLQAEGDAQGLHGYDDRGLTDRRVHAAGVHRARPAETVYICPTNRCARFWWPQGPSPVPRCVVSSDPLLRARL